MRSDSRLERIVPPEITMETAPAKERGAFSAPCITGHAEPSSASGRPKLIKAR